MVNHVLLSLDVEKFVPLEELGISSDEELQFDISQEGLNRFKDLLEDRDLAATYFTTLDYYKRYKDTIIDISKRGSEIALHGHTHSHDYSTMEEDKVQSLLSDCKITMDKDLHGLIKGFRAPRGKKPDTSILQRLGFFYDSSVNPIYLPSHYNNLSQSRKVHHNGAVIEIPLSATPIVRLPLFWAAFRLLPLQYTKFCSAVSLIDTTALVLNFHPWEFVDLSHYRGKLPKSRVMNTGEELANKLDKFIDWCKGRNMKFITFEGYMESEVGEN